MKGMDLNLSRISIFVTRRLNQTIVEDEESFKRNAVLRNVHFHYWSEDKFGPLGEELPGDPRH